MEEAIQDPALSAAISLARLASETRCGNVVLLDVRQRSPVTKFFLIATGTSARQMRTVADELCKAGEFLGFKPWRTSGYESARWILVDFVDVVLHVFDEASRQYYDLELLWGDCPKIQWRDPNQPELPAAELQAQNDMTDSALANVQEQLSYSFEFWEEKSDQTIPPDSAAIEEISPADVSDESFGDLTAGEPLATEEVMEVIEIQERPARDAADRPKKALVPGASKKPLKKKPRPAPKAKAVGAKVAKKPAKKAEAGTKARKTAAGGKAAKAIKPARAGGAGKTKIARKPVKKTKKPMAVKRVVKKAPAKKVKKAAKPKAKKSSPAKKGRAKSR